MRMPSSIMKKKSQKNIDKIIKSNHDIAYFMDYLIQGSGHSFTEQEKNNIMLSKEHLTNVSNILEVMAKQIK